MAETPRRDDANDQAPAADDRDRTEPVAGNGGDQPPVGDDSGSASASASADPSSGGKGEDEAARPARRKRTRARAPRRDPETSGDEPASAASDAPEAAIDDIGLPPELFGMEPAPESSEGAPPRRNRERDRPRDRDRDRERDRDRDRGREREREVSVEPRSDLPPISLTELKRRPAAELLQYAEEIGIENASTLQER